MLAWMLFCWSFCVCEYTMGCMIRLWRYGIIVLNLLSETLGGMLLLASTDDMSAEVELLAVVWEVWESILYKSSSPLLSSSPDIDSGGDGIIIEEAFGSTGMGLACGLVVTLGLPLEALATLGITSLFFIRVCDPLFHWSTWLSAPALQGQ